MQNWTRWIPLAALVATACLHGTANAAVDQIATAPADSAVVTVSPAATPLEREVADLRDTFRIRLTELTARYGAATSSEAAAAAQHEIAALKLQLEIDLLSIQLRLAHEREDAAAVTELDQILTAARTRLAVDTGLGAPAAAGDKR